LTPRGPDGGGTADAIVTRITPLVLTFNEAPNLARTLSRLSWARDIIVVDSGSTDETRAIAATYANVRVFERPFTTHAEQWNFGLRETAIATEWVLALDADFVLSDDVVRELATLRPTAGAAGYRASFVYCVDGKPLRGAAYPPVVVLYRRAAATYLQDGHTQRVAIDGLVLPLAGKILHDDRKPLTHWLAAQSRYMKLEAAKLGASAFMSLGWPDRLRRLIVVAPVAMFLYCYILRGGILDGKAGLFYALQRAVSETILSLFLVDRMLHPGGDRTQTP
jgi:glycosyltransferase involved in cell wall biosynthesis